MLYSMFENTVKDDVTNLIKNLDLRKAKEKSTIITNL